MIHPTAKIHDTAIIGPRVYIGEHVYIGPYCIIGYPAEHKGFWHAKNNVESEYLVIVGNKCVITGHVTIDAGTEHPTEIGEGVWLMKHSHVGHDATIGDGAVLSCGAKIGGHAIIGSNTTIGLNAVIHQRKEVPPGCMIGMGAVITKNLVMMINSKYAGNPARLLGPNVKP